MKVGRGALCTDLSADVAAVWVPVWVAAKLVVQLHGIVQEEGGCCEGRIAFRLLIRFPEFD